MRIFRTGLLMLVAMVAGVAACSAPAKDDHAASAATAPRLVVGVTANALDDDLVRTTGAVRAAGLRWMREEFRWPLIEPTRGQLRFDRYDRLMTTSAEQGIRILPLLFGTPSWTGAKHQNEQPADRPEWSSFTRAVVGRYGPGGTFWRSHPRLDARLAPTTWEIWNEAYLPQFSFPRVDPARYARLVVRTVRAGRRTSPRVRFLASVETDYRAPDGSVRNWLEDMYRAVPQLGDVLDGLAVHPYSLGAPGDRGASRALQFDRIDDFRPILRRLGIGPRPLWITEMGWSTCSRQPPCQTQEEQRRYYAAALQRVVRQHADEVDAFFAYRLDDIAAQGPDDPQSGFGLVARGGRPKPALAVLKAAAAAARRSR